MDKDYNERGCLAFSLAVISSLFESLEKNSHKIKSDRKFDAKVERAFLETNFVQATCDCTDNFSQENLLKQFDQKYIKYEKDS